MKVEIYFNNLDSTWPELVYSETVKNTTNINKVYRLTGLLKGTYKFVYTTEGRVFTKEISN